MQPEPPSGVPAFTPPDPATRRGVPAWLILVIVLAAVVVIGGVVTTVVLLRGGSTGNGTIGFGDHSGRRTLDHFVQLRPVTATHDAPCRSEEVPGKDGTSGKDTCYRLGTGMTVSAVDDLVVQPGTGTDGGAVLLVSLRPDDGKRFAELTGKVATASPPGNQLAIVVRHEVVSAPLVTDAIPGGKLQIAGSFSADQATDLANRILT